MEGPQGSDPSLRRREEIVRARARRSTKRSRTGCLTCKYVSYYFVIYIPFPKRQANHGVDSGKSNVTRQSPSVTAVEFLELAAMAMRNQPQTPALPLYPQLQIEYPTTNPWLHHRLRGVYTLTARKTKGSSTLSSWKQLMKFPESSSLSSGNE